MALKLKKKKPAKVAPVTKPTFIQPALQAEAAKVEERMARAIEKAIVKMQGMVSIYELTVALQSKDVAKCLALFPAAKLADALTPVAKIAEDCVLKGGRVAAEAINGRA